MVTSHMTDVGEYWAGEMAGTLSSSPVVKTEIMVCLRLSLDTASSRKRSKVSTVNLF